MVSEVEILLDGQVVQVDRGGFLSITNTLNRLFVPSTRRTEIVGHPYILHNEEDKKMLGNATDDETKFLYKSPSYEYALNSLNAVGKKTGKKAVQLKSDLDGIFLLSRPKNLGLEAMSRCHSGYNQHPLIPPNTEDVVVLGVPELKLANGEAEVADVPPNTELEAIKEKKIVKSKY